MPLPQGGMTITTNFSNLPVSISWDADWLDVRIPTNRSDLALRFVSVEDSDGNKAINPSGSWSQHGFRKGSFMWRKDGVLTLGGVKPNTLTLAIVTNVHATFYVQPVLLPDEHEK